MADPYDLFPDLTSDDVLAVLVVTRDPAALQGWRADVRAAEWVGPVTLARVLRQAADRYDPPALVDFTAEHHPECTCDRCTGSRDSDHGRTRAPV